MKYYLNIKTLKKIIFHLILVPIISLIYTLIPFDVYAQNPISISVTPPLSEVIIQPGKEISQIFNVTNLGGKTSIKPKIVYFEPSDLSGNVKLTDAIAPDWIKFDHQPFTLDQDQNHNFVVLISPSVDIPETDHFLTILFETAKAEDLLNDNSAFYNAQVGANILLTVSVDGKPKKKAEIVSFKAPRLIDWLMDVKYELVFANTGNSFWKPIGKININEDEFLSLAPLNILSGHSRNIPCLTGENLTECRSAKRILIGKKEAKLEFTLDDEPQIYNQQITTLVFPFSLLLVIIILVLVSKLIIYLLTKKSIRYKLN